ncbi:MAG: ABC transporter permease [Lactococcus sp.]|jgi:ABC-2 type transport system permease protein
MEVGGRMAKDINDLFAKRRANWRAQNLKYLRYVLNDHFVLILMLLIGFLAYQYADFLKSLPAHWLPGYVIAVLVSLMVLFFGRLATFVERADQQFLLAKEKSVQAYLISAVKKSLIFPAIVIVLVTLIISPLVKSPLPFTLVWAIVLIALKYVLLTKKAQSFVQDDLIQWQSLIQYEKNRQNAVLKVFSQFTDVKGLQQQAKRRKYLDILLPKSKMIYDYLFIRTFLRSGDYWLLMLRLLGLAVLSLIFIPTAIFALLLALVFDYLLVFQLLPIRQSQDYQLLTHLYPLKASAKNLAAGKLIRYLMFAVCLLELVVSLLTFQDKLLAAVFVPIAVFLGVLYPKWKLK